jgi:hypothetical protein
MPNPRQDKLSRAKLAEVETPALKQQGRQPLHMAMERQEERALVDPKAAKKPTRDKGLVEQYSKLTKATPALIEKLIAAAMDETHPHHEMAFKLAIERVAPLKFWQGLAEADQGGGGGAARPTISVIVNTVQAPSVEIVANDPNTFDAETTQ